MKQLLRDNTNHEKETFLDRLHNGYFDIGLFNEVLGGLISYRSSSEFPDPQVHSMFALFAFDCLTVLSSRRSGVGTTAIRNIEEVDVPKVIDSLYYCLAALAYTKPIDWTVLLPAFPK